MIEEWRQVQGTRFLISNMGRLAAIEGRAVKTYWKNGYKCICVRKGDERYIHRIVAEYFVRGWFQNACVDHIDNDRTNNAYLNLEWVTREENSRRAKGLVKQSQVVRDKNITRLVKNGMRQCDVALMFGVSTGRVSQIVKEQLQIKRNQP